MTDIRDEVTLEIRYGGERRRVRVRLGPPFDLAPSGERRRRLRMVTDGAEAACLVEPGISWDAVLAQVEMLLAFDDESREEAAR